MYAFFAAEGRVISVDEKTSKKGTTFTVLLLDVSDGKYEHELEVTAFHGAAESTGGLRKGDLVAVSGRLESPMNQSGYRNARVTAGTVVKVVPFFDVFSSTEMTRPSAAKNAYMRAS